MALLSCLRLQDLTFLCSLLILVETFFFFFELLRAAEFVVTFHDFLSFPLHNARRMVSSMGVDHQTTEYFALKLSSFVSNEITEDPRFVGNL